MDDERNIDSSENTEPFIPEPEARAVAMELIWRCMNCGFIFPVGEQLPEYCPNCGKGKEYFVHVTED